nr:nitroreductase family protein [uncultured Methanoregula sp.]
MNPFVQFNAGIIMCTDIFEQRNVSLDQILAERRSYRVFRPEHPSDDEIRRILHAGLLAPFAAAAVGNSKDYFRRFFVMRSGSASLNATIPLVMRHVASMARELESEMEKNPALREKAGMFAQRLSAIKKKGTVPGIGTAPFYIVVAERRGFPPVELQSLAHCMENMWLKATALELGFQLVSITSQMSQDPAFCKILGIPVGEWELMGCAVGYPADELSPSIRPPVEDVTRWLE